MKNRTSAWMVIALAGVFTFFSVSSAMAQLYFSSMQGTWWVGTKVQEKGNVFISQPADGSIGKADKLKRKWKYMYVYIPEDSLNGLTLENIIRITPGDEGGFDVATDVSLTIQGGTPYDFVFVEEIVAEGESSLLVLQTKINEDKKNLGNIKSGQIIPLGGSFYYPSGDEMVFAGNREIRLKWIPESKVPDQIKEIVFPPE